MEPDKRHHAKRRRSAPRTPTTSNNKTNEDASRSTEDIANLSQAQVD